MKAQASEDSRNPLQAGARTVPVQRSAFVGSEPDPSFHWLIPLDSDTEGMHWCFLLLCLLPSLFKLVVCFSVS